MNYLKLIRKVFANDGLENNIKLFKSVQKAEYVDEYLDHGFIFASFTKIARKNIDSAFLLYNYHKINEIRKEDDAYIDLLIVDPDYQGMGIGRELIRKFINKCKEKNIKNIYLWTDLTCNKEFYDKCGFEIVIKYNNPHFEEFCNIPCVSDYNTIIYKLSLS